MFNTIPDSVSMLSGQMLSECIRALKINTFNNNYDRERFDFDGVDKSNIFNAGSCSYWFDWFFRNVDSIYRTLMLFEDVYSKRLFLKIIAYRMCGHHSVVIPVNFCESDNDSDWINYKKLEIGVSSSINLNGMFGGLKHFDFIFEGVHYLVDCLSLKYYLHRRQYYLKRKDVTICPVSGDHVIDGGACFGDTGIVFANSVGPSGLVYCFDPVWDHIQVLDYNLQQNPHLKIKVMPYGLADSDVDGKLLKANTYSPGFRTGGSGVPLRSIDSLVIDREIAKIDFIKLDIEGAELAALKGAFASINKFNPKLGISIYHKPNDIFEIPLYISENFANYKFYLDHYTIHNEETVLYCAQK